MGLLHGEEKQLILASPVLRSPVLPFCVQRDIEESLQELQPYFSHLITLQLVCFASAT